MSGTPAWTLLTPSGVPPSPRFGHGAIYDAIGDRLLIFGGGNGASTNDVWQLSLAGSATWSQVVSTGAAPAPRFGMAAALDAQRYRLVIWGGDTTATYSSSSGALADGWSLNLTGAPVWVPLAPGSTAPTARGWTAAMYDPLGDRLVLFGGLGAGNIVTNDMWA